MKTIFPFDRVIPLAILSVLAAVSGGCGPKLPENLPALQPCTVLVTMDGAPLAGAIVSLSPDSGQWYANGITDAAGKVAIKTQGKYPGAAAGPYKVLVSKTVSSDPNWIPASEADKPPTDVVHVDPLFGDATKTPLSCDVKEGGNELTFDVKPPKS